MRRHHFSIWDVCLPKANVFSVFNKQSSFEAKASHHNAARPESRGKISIFLSAKPPNGATPPRLSAKNTKSARVD
jgi:hypothetical protein